MSMIFGITTNLTCHWGLRVTWTRTITLGVLAMSAFGLFEQWPKRLPPWLARWVLQVIAVALVMPLGNFSIWVLATDAGAPAFWRDPGRLDGMRSLTFTGLLVAPWAALGALVRQKEAIARHQALAFDLERSELERRALDARFQVLQTQVAPHFLFNTLANVQALVDAGSPRASALLGSLVAYLRAAVPRLDEPTTTFGRELELVRAYLELMHMRMPDRLEFSLDADPSTAALRCPPLAVLTLVENAVRHGIDPSEEGGRIDVQVHRRGARCVARILDTGIGLNGARSGLGTGLSTLRERVRLLFGEDASVRLTAREPRGACAELDLPVLEGTA
jgi:hypothetical protein